MSKEQLLKLVKEKDGLYYLKADKTFQKAVFCNCLFNERCDICFPPED